MTEIIRVSKLDVARRQLYTAIMLWFADGDQVSIHTLAYAAYEIIHVISKKRQRDVGLLFDAEHVKDKYRKEFNLLLKKHANFFKHAKNDTDDEIEFRPVLSDLFLMFCVRGIDSMKLPRNDAETAFIMWQCIQKPKFLKDEGLKRFIDSVGVDGLRRLQSVSKEEFMQVFSAYRQRNYPPPPFDVPA